MPARVNLPQPYASALDAAVAYLAGRYAPVAIVASGSVVRGTGHETSDLDLVVVHEPAWRQRVQRRFDGVPCEMFVNPVFQIRNQMEKDTRAGRPVMAHMLATGFVVHDPGGISAMLQDEARANLAAGPRVDPAWLELRRYGIATAFEDAVDIATSEPDRSRTLVIESITQAANWRFLADGRWLPRSKDLFNDLDTFYPGIGARAVVREADLTAQLARAEGVVHDLIGATRFFEWESEPEDVQP